MVSWNLIALGKRAGMSDVFREWRVKPISFRWAKLVYKNEAKYPWLV